MFIDSESTHNFIDSRVDKKANYYTQPQNSFELMISNIGKISYKGKCCNVRINMGDCQLQSDMYALPLGGRDVVLGA